MNQGYEQKWIFIQEKNKCKDIAYTFLYVFDLDYIALTEIDCSSVDHCWWLNTEQQ
jgi:hypothetical protein